MASEGLLSVVIPVYRSEQYLAKTVHELVAYLEPRRAFEIVLVVDGSPDGVRHVAHALSAQDRRIRSIEIARNIGQHRATLVGCSRARGDVVVTVDDDGQNPPSSVIAVSEELFARDLDVVYGRFTTVEQSLPRRTASSLNRWLSNRIIQNGGNVALSNVRAIRGDLSRALGGVSTAYPYIDAMCFRMTNRVGDVPVEHRPRGAGASSYTFAKLLRLWVSHLTSLSVLPLTVATIGSFGASALGFGVGAAQLVRVMAERKAPPGWLSLFCAVTFLFSLLFLFLGIISTYVGRTYVTLNDRDLTWIRSASGVSSSDAEDARERPITRTGTGR